MSPSRKTRRAPTAEHTMERNRTFGQSSELLRSPNQIPNEVGDASNYWTENPFAARTIQLSSAKRPLIGVDAVLGRALIECTDSAAAEIQGLEPLIPKSEEHLP